MKKTKRKYTKKIKAPVSEAVPTYFLIMKFNDETHEVNTANLAESINNLKPRFLKTKVQFKIVNPEGKICERQLFVKQGKLIFRNKLSLQIFIQRLIFK